MTNEQQKAKELAVLLTAFSEGKQLEYMIGSSSWSNYTDLDIRKFGMNIANGYKYRIKSETKRIVLTMQDLIDRELMKETMRLSNSELILSWHHNFLKTIDNAYSYSYLLDNEFTFLDGTPCYKEMESE